ncbi:MAG TPA: FtsX-like permease family protein [Microthrixaceae bacterium]|nr:FtsX-like permease family protein [Microthrixaceae bacterium]
MAVLSGACRNRYRNIEELLADERVVALSDSRGKPVEVADHVVSGYSFDMRRDSVAWTLLECRLPTSPDEILVGQRLARRDGIEMGDRVTVVGDVFPGTDRPREREVTVVGRGLGPGRYNDFGDDVVLTSDAFDPCSATALVTGSYREAYLDLEPGTFDDFIADHGAELEIDGSLRLDEVENLASLSALPYVLGGFLAIIGLAALANALVVIGSQRRRELGTLRALGMTSRGLRLSMCIAGLAIATLGVVIGAPLGVIVGSTVWRVLASSAYVDNEPLLSPWLIVVPMAALVVGSVVSLLAGARANRGALAPALRSE